MTEPVEPGGVVGIIGGGQLGRMLALAAARLGLKCVVLEPGEDCPAAQVAWRHLDAAYDDPGCLTTLAELSDVVTYEFENVLTAALDALEGKVPVHPNRAALSTAQDRLSEKLMLTRLGIRTAPFHAVESHDDLNQAISDIGVPAVLKIRRLGYDGKGQVRIDSSGQTDDALHEIGHVPAILEGFVIFDREISVLIARGSDGSMAEFDISENVHRNHILHTSTIPADIAGQTQKWAVDAARKIVTELDYVGVMALELFVTPSGSIVANEIAPRVHNSGHWTQNACAVDQFEQHIRAICGWPLGSPARHSDVVMTNLIGREAGTWQELARQPGTSVHLYGKSRARPGRKMGHVNVIGPKT